MKTDNEFYYNGFGNNFFIKYLYNDFLTNTPTQGQTGFFYGSDNYLNTDLGILEQDTTIKYKIGSHGFRCDEFKDVENNFLFAGCSETFGLGIPNEYRWSYILNNALSGPNFYDLSVPAASIHTIVNNVVSYLKNIGKPKTIFIMFPDLYRMPNFVFYKNEKYLMTNFVVPEFDDERVSYSSNPKYIAINAIIMLEFICELMNVDLVWSTWDLDFNKEILDNKLNIRVFKKYINVLDNMDYKYVKEKSFDIYGEFARDKVHFGGYTHIMFSKVFEQEYRKIMNEE